MSASTNTLGMLLGIFAAGPLADRLAVRNVLWPARIMLLASISASVPAILLFIIQDLHLILATMAVMGFFAVGPASAPPVHRLRPFPENQRKIGRAHV